MVKLKEPECIKQKLYSVTGHTAQRKLAEVLKINRNTLRRVLNGDRIHRRDNAAKLATALGEKESDIFQPA